jgi:hypothetical protein
MNPKEMLDDEAAPMNVGRRGTLLPHAFVVPEYFDGYAALSAPHP